MQTTTDISRSDAPPGAGGASQSGGDRLHLGDHGADSQRQRKPAECNGAAARFRQVPENLLRPSKARPDPRRLAYAHSLATLARVVSNGRQHHGATLKALALALRGAGWSPGRIGKRWGVTPRAVREWCEPGASAVPTASRTVRRIVAHARQLAGVEGSPMFEPGSMAALLEHAVAAWESHRHEEACTSAEGELVAPVVAGPSDVADAAERLWPSCRGLLGSKARTSVLACVRMAVMRVLDARGFPHEAIGAVVGRERNTVSYHVGGAR